jgi:hypothetical protein
MTNGDELWTVTGQQETTGQTESGSYAEGVKVTFRTRDGMVGSVFCPRALYSDAYVAQLINDYAEMSLRVSSLKG